MSEVCHYCGKPAAYLSLLYPDSCDGPGDPPGWHICLDPACAKKAQREGYYILCSQCYFLRHSCDDVAPAWAKGGFKGFVCSM